MLSLKQLCFFALCGGKESPCASTTEYFYEKFKGQFQEARDSQYSCWIPKDVALWKCALPEDLFCQLMEFKQTFYSEYLDSDFEYSFYRGERVIKRARLVFDVEETKHIYVDGEWKVLTRTYCEKQVEIDHTNDPPAWTCRKGFVKGTVSGYIVSKLSNEDVATLKLMDIHEQERGEARAILDIKFAQ